MKTICPPGYHHMHIKHVIEYDTIFYIYSG